MGTFDISIALGITRTFDLVGVNLNVASFLGRVDIDISPRIADIRTAIALR